MGLLLLGCADRESPRWPAGASLTLERVRPGRLAVRWPEANEEARYRVTVDGVVRSLAPAREQLVDGVSPGEVEVRVVAVDAFGNASVPLVARAPPIEAPIEAPPEEPPGFAAHARLNVTVGAPGDSGDRPIELAWPAAEDPAVGYVVLVDGEVAAEVAAGAERRRVELLRALDGAEVFEVRARDAAGREGPGLFSLAPQAPPVAPDEASGAPIARLAEVQGVWGGRSDDASLDAVRGVLERRLPSAAGCYRRALADGPVFDGHVTLELAIDASGRPTQITMVGAGIARPRLIGCLRGVLSRVELGAGPEGAVRARYLFSPR